MTRVFKIFHSRIFELSVKTKFDKRRADQTERMEQTKATADSLQVLASQRLHEIATAVSGTIDGERHGFRAFMAQQTRTSGRIVLCIIR